MKVDIVEDIGKGINKEQLKKRSNEVKEDDNNRGSDSKEDRQDRED